MGKMKELIEERDLELSRVPAMEVPRDWYKSNGTVNVVMPGGPSLTRQEFAAEADINEIMRRFERTGVLPPVQGEPMYVDWTSMPANLMDAMDKMYSAEDAFMQLPALVRKEFDNNPIQFVEYASNPDNVEQMRKWGLAKPLDPLPEAVTVPVPTPQAAAPAPAAEQAKSSAAASPKAP